MLVMTLTDCPPGLRGYLTKWLLEIHSGVFVGQVNARIRESLWVRIQEMCKNGNAVMVYSVNNEQKMDFRVLGTTWEPIDFDGIKLMLRPSSARLKEKHEKLRAGFSSAAKWRTAKRIDAARARLPADYAVVDLETTGLNPEKDEIIEIGALKVVQHEAESSFSAFVRTAGSVPAEIEKLTGISEQMLLEKGEDLRVIFPRFVDFVGNLPIVSHNADFDCAFLRYACAECALPLFSNRCIDTLSLAKRVVSDVKDYKLPTLAAYFGIDTADRHRSADDCQTTYRLYEKLINLMNTL
jgi:CRISPR-associated protein Cas2